MKRVAIVFVTRARTSYSGARQIDEPVTHSAQYDEEERDGFHIRKHADPPPDH
jgi:hypothetical protein